MDTNRNHRGAHTSHASNLMDLPLSTSSFQSAQSQHLSSILPSSSLPHSNLQQQTIVASSSDTQPYFATAAPTTTTTTTTATTANTHMIGTSTAFYDDALHGPAVVMTHETEQDHEMYLASFQSQPQPSYGYPLAYPDSHTQPGAHTHTQHSHSQPPPQYLPTPSVSPTSTSPPIIPPSSRPSYPQSDIKQSGQNYPMSGTINMGAGAHRESSTTAGTQNSKKSKGASANHPSSTAAISSNSNTMTTAKPSPSSSRKRARKSIDKPPSPTQASGRTQSGQNDSQAALQLQDDSDDEDQEDRNQPTQRLPGACRYCKKLKMKCEFLSPDAASCKRCMQGGHQCVVEGRKQRIGPNKREFLLAQLRQKETIIESLLRQINNPAHRTPLTLLVPNLSNVAGNASSNLNGPATGTPQGASSKSIQSWIAGTSVKNAGGRGGSAAFVLDKRADGTGVDLDEEEVDDSTAARRRLDDDPDGDEGDEDDEGDEGVDPTGNGKKVKLHYLPEEAAPLGLIADLSLENHTPKKKEKEKDKDGSVGAKEDGPVVQHQSESRMQTVVSSNMVGVSDAVTGADASNVPSALGNASGGPIDGTVNAQATVNASATGAGNNATNNNAGEEENENNVGVANKSYFHPGPATDLGLRRVMIERTMPPDILVHGLVTPEDVEELFKIFYERINVFLSILDPAIHTPARTFARCPFLFTVVCAISSRYYVPKASIYKYAMHFAKSAAASSLIDGWKSVELCQAYLLMSVYAVPARRWEEDRSWLYLGLAIRIATDLNLHQPSSAAVTAAAANTNANSASGNANGSPIANASSSSGGRGRLHNQNHYPPHPGSTASAQSTMSASSPSPSASMTPPGAPTSPSLNISTSATSKSSEKQEKHERELLNRTRTWLICFNLDRSISTQLGKPSTIKEDFIIRNASEWYKRSPFNMPYDVHLCAYTELLRIVTRFHDDVWSGSRPVSNAGIKGTDVDFYGITMRYDDQLRLFQEQAAARFERDSKKDDPGSVYRTGLLPFMVNYSRLVMFSFGFQQAVERGLQRDDMFFQRCFEAACAVITTVVDRLAPTGYLRFAPDGHFIFVSFAAAFLLKLLRPDFSRIVNRTHKEQVLTLVRKLIRMLGSQEVAVDDKHTPKLYSRFLAGLVSRHSTSRKSVSMAKNAGTAIGNQNGTSQVPMRGGPIMQQPGPMPAVRNYPPTEQNEHNFDVYGNLVSAPPMMPQPTHDAPYPSMYDDRLHHLHQEQQGTQQPNHSQPHSISPGYYPPSGNVPGSGHDHQYISGMNAGNGGVGMETVIQPSSQSGEYNQVIEHYDDDLGGTFPLPISENDQLASMQAINNQGWWENVMMPGFSLPSAHHFTHNNNNSNVQQPQYQTQYNQMEIESAQVSHGHSHVHPHHPQSRSQHQQQSQYMASQDRNMQTYSDSGEYTFRYDN